MTSPKTIDNILNGSKDDVEKELFMRAIHPQFESRSCYSEQTLICQIANKIEACSIELCDLEGFVPSTESIDDYELWMIFNLLGIWLGCLITVLIVPVMNLGKRLTQVAILVLKKFINPPLKDICPNCGQICATTNVLCPNCGKNLDELFEQLPDLDVPPSIRNN
jgi:hypothetical protein